MKRKFPVIALLAVSCGLYLNAEAAKNGGGGGGYGGGNNGSNYSQPQQQQSFTPSGPSAPSAVNDTTSYVTLSTPTYSSTKADKLDPKMPSDDVLRKYLSPAQLSQWNDALKKIKDGDDEVSAGQILAKRIPASTTDDLTVVHQQGNDEVKEGEGVVDKALATIAGLRKVALAAMNNNPDTMPGAGVYGMRLSATTWPPAIKGLTDAMMSALWAANYKNVYLADVYSFEDSHYVAKPDATDALSKAIVQSDTGHNTFTAKHDWKFMLKKDGGQLVIDFPDRAAFQQDNTKAALVVGELLYDHDSGYATFSLRAVDVADWHIIYNKLTMFAVEPKLGKMIGLADYQVPSGKNFNPTATSGTQPSVAAKVSGSTSSSGSSSSSAANGGAPTALEINIEGAGGLVNTFKSASKPYIFRALTDGKDNSLDNRYALLLLKSVLVDNTSLTITDYDFLSTVLPGADADRSLPAAGINVAWVVPDVGDYTEHSIQLDLKAKNLASSTEIDAGKLNIARTLSPLTRPTEADLKDGGYTIQPATTH
jgi:hypothetical protein